MAHTRLITLNGSAGAFVAVSATQVTRRVGDYRRRERQWRDRPERLAYQFNDGSATPFTTTYTIEPQQEPIVLGTPCSRKGAGFALVVGTPGR